MSKRVLQWLVENSVKLCLAGLLSFAASGMSQADEIQPLELPTLSLSSFLAPVESPSELSFPALLRSQRDDLAEADAKDDADDDKDDDDEKDSATDDDKDAADDDDDADDDGKNERDEEALATVRRVEFSGGNFSLPQLAAVSTSTTDIGNGRIPEGFRAGEPAAVALLPESGTDRGGWGHATSYWAAANTFSHPRYFEDRMLERHGHEKYSRLTPILSGVHFFATIPALPYLMTVDHPCECESTLGYLRPGSCVPAYRQRPPYKREAILAEAAAIAAGVLIFP